LFNVASCWLYLNICVFALLGCYSALTIGPIFKGQAGQVYLDLSSLEESTNKLSWNTGN